MPTDCGPWRPPAHGAPPQPQPPELDEAGWRTAREVQALRDTIGAYRTGASALAAQVTELRAEVARLSAKLRANRASQGVADIEVTITLDEFAPDLVRAIVVAELAGGLSPKGLEDVQLVASELTANGARRRASCPAAQAVLRIEASGTVLRIELEDLSTGPENPAPPATNDDVDDFGLDIVRRLSERWGSEQSALGRTTMWADVMDRAAGHQTLSD